MFFCRIFFLPRCVIGCVFTSLKNTPETSVFGVNNFSVPCFIRIDFNKVPELQDATYFLLARHLEGIAATLSV